LPQRNTSKKAVVCGGLLWSLSKPSTNVSLQYKLKNKLQKNVPCIHILVFPVFNVSMPKEIFQRICFNDTFTQYGYEDITFGLELEKQEI